jgi:hypothetical protein
VLIASTRSSGHRAPCKDGNKDGADHRCLTQDQNPMTLDVRLVLALPDYSTPSGKKDLKTLFMLGNPTAMQAMAGS